MCNKGITQFYLPPTHEPYLPLLPSCKAYHRPLAGTNLYCLVTEAHRCEKLAQSFYAACPAETRTHDLLIASPILYRQRHDATSNSHCTERLYTGRLNAVETTSRVTTPHLSATTNAGLIIDNLWNNVSDREDTMTHHRSRASVCDCVWPSKAQLLQRNRAAGSVSFGQNISGR